MWYIVHKKLVKANLRAAFRSVDLRLYPMNYVYAWKERLSHLRSFEKGVPNQQNRRPCSLRAGAGFVLWHKNSRRAAGPAG